MEDQPEKFSRETVRSMAMLVRYFMDALGHWQLTCRECGGEFREAREIGDMVVAMMDDDQKKGEKGNDVEK